MFIDVTVNGSGGDLQQHHHNPHHNHLHQPQQILLGESSGEDHEVKAPKKRAETWVQEETRSLIILRRGFDDTSISFGSLEANGRPALNLERRLDHDGHPLAITTVDAIVANGVPPWNWREPPGNGGDAHGEPFGGRVITVKFGDYTRRIGIDGSSEAIKETIRSAFGLRTRRAFWLEDEDEVVRCLDRDMPLGNYLLHLDNGLAIRVCHYDESNQLPVHSEEKIFYSEEDYRDFLARRGWICLQVDGFRNIDNMDDLQPGAVYRGVR